MKSSAQLSLFKQDACVYASRYIEARSDLSSDVRRKNLKIDGERVARLDISDLNVARRSSRNNRRRRIAILRAIILLLCARAVPDKRCASRYDHKFSALCGSKNDREKSCGAWVSSTMCV